MGEFVSGNEKMEAKTSKNIKAASENPSYFYFHALSSSASAFQSHNHKMAAVFPDVTSAF